VLILLDGEPVLRPMPASSLQRVVNTPALMVKDPASAKYYVFGEGRWFAADSITGPWSLVQTPPAEIAAMQAGSGSTSDSNPEGVAPRIIVGTHPTELIMTRGLPDYRPIRGTALLYAANTDNQLFFDKTGRESYVCCRAAGLRRSRCMALGPAFLRWTCPPTLPGSLPGVRRQSCSRLCLIRRKRPRHSGKLRFYYSHCSASRSTAEGFIDGEPQFKPMKELI
jgi:hypothetical protein